MSNRAKQSLLVQLKLENGSTKIQRLKGREAWAMQELMKAGPSGCTPLYNPAPRWAAYVHGLRSLSIRIDTITEPHGGPYAGNHARYVLRTPCAVVCGQEGGGV